MPRSSRVALNSQARSRSTAWRSCALRQHAMLARLLLLVRLVVGEAIEQRRLQPLLRRELLSHDQTPASAAAALPARTTSVRSSISGTSVASVARMRWPRPWCVSGRHFLPHRLARQRDQAVVRTSPSRDSASESAPPSRRRSRTAGAPASRPCRADPPAPRS